MRATKQIRREAKRVFRLCLADGRLDEGRARQVAQHLSEAGKRHGLAILREFKRLVKLESARRTAVVESAALLPDDLRAEVEARLAQMYGPGLSTSFETIPALIGGMRVQVGSDVYDGSVRAGLAALETNL